MDIKPDMFAIIYTGIEENDIPRLYYYYQDFPIIDQDHNENTYELYLTYCKRLVGLQQITNQLFEEQNNNQQWFTFKQSKLLVQYQKPYYFIFQSQKATYQQLNQGINFILQCIYANNSQIFEEKEYKKDIQPLYPLDQMSQQIIQMFLQSFYQCSEICQYHGILAPKTTISIYLYASFLIKEIKSNIQSFNNVIVTWQKRIILTECNNILANYIIIKESLNQLTEDKIQTYSNIYQLPETLYIQQIKQGELKIFIISDQQIKKPQLQIQNYADRLKQYVQPSHPIIDYPQSQVLIDTEYNIFGVDYAGYLRKYGYQFEQPMLQQRKDENNIKNAVLIQNTKYQQEYVLESTKYGEVYALYQSSKMQKFQDIQKQIEIWVNI